jgi:hypothetical protein
VLEGWGGALSTHAAQVGKPHWVVPALIKSCFIVSSLCLTMLQVLEGYSRGIRWGTRGVLEGYSRGTAVVAGPLPQGPDLCDIHLRFCKNKVICTLILTVKMYRFSTRCDCT